MIDPETIRTYDSTALAYEEETADFWDKFPKTFIDNFTKSVGEGLGVDTNRLRYFTLYLKDELGAALKKAGFQVFYFEHFQPKSRNYLNFLARKAGHVS